MAQVDNVIQQPSVYWRILVTLLYIGGTMALLLLIVNLLVTPPCYQNKGCSKVDQIFYAVMGLFDFILAFVLTIVGMKGQLPGARKKTVAVQQR